MKHLGDITQIKGSDAPVVDCIIGGSPCQDLSVAGKRAGLAGERSGLYMEQIRIIKEMRKADELRGRTDVDIRPRYMVWENVPGAFSSNQGKDFAAVLEEAIRVAEPEAPDVPVPEKGWPTSGCFMGDQWSIAWRVLDAQFWGTSDKPLPQRRRRIALVADFGGLSAPEILFVRKSVSGDLEPGEPKRKATAGNAGEGSGGAIGCDVYNLTTSGDKAVSLTTASNATGTGPTVAVPKAVVFPLGFRPENVRCYDETATTLCNGTRPGFTTGVVQEQPLCTEMTSTKNTIVEDSVCPTLTARMETGGNQVNAVLDAICSDGDIAGTLDASYYKGPGMRSGLERTFVTQPACTFEMKAFGKYDDSGLASTLKSRDYKDATDLIVAGADCRNATEYPELNGTIQAKSGGGFSLNCNQVVRIKHIVRRLTPLECERLQGFPDGWTDIGDWVDSTGKKRKAADSPRYKALGNSIAIPPWKWVLKRLCACYERDATMASLFDGIGGFPYIWEQLNGKGSCLWASEIEEFPMAVTKIRFG